MRVILFFCLSMLAGFALKSQDFYRINSVHDIRITFETPDWDHILDSLKQGDGGRITADVTIDGLLYEKAGVRYKGNSSYFSVRKDELNKLPFNIKLNHGIEEQKLPEGIETLKLSNVFRDPSYLREVLAYEIAREYMVAPRANFIQLFINDQPVGLYNSSESIDDKFLADHFGYEDGVLIKCDPLWETEPAENCPEGDGASLRYLGQDSLCYMHLYELKTDDGWQDLIELTQMLNEETERIEEVLDVDQTLWMLAFDNVLVNLDSYIGKLCHNYYLYKDSLGYFHPIVWDMNMAFGGFTFTGLEPGHELKVEQMQRLSPLIHFKEKNAKRPLINLLLQNDFYRKVYIAHIRTILEEQFANKRYIKRAKKIQELIDPYVKEDENRLYPYPAFKFNFEHNAQAGAIIVAGITELMEKRREYLQNHPLIKAEPPRIIEAEHAAGAEVYTITARVEEAKQLWLCYRYGSQGVFQRIKMSDDGNKQDGLAEDGLWSVNIPKIEGAQYYIIAENQAAVSLLPKRAAHEFFEIIPKGKTAE